ncbi:MAG: TraB/GumN family protein [Novosphingobium sp.]
MKRLFGILSAMAFGLGCFHAPVALARESDPSAAPAPAITPLAISVPEGHPRPVRPPLWRVADEDTVIWLFGTIHALPGNVAWYDGQVATALEGSLELVTEIGEVKPETMQVAVLSRALLPQGEKLRDKLTPEQRARYEACLSRLSIPAERFDPLKPWFAAVNLVMAQLARQGITGGQGVEATIDARAKRLGLRPAALETVEYQFAQFDSLAPDVQVRYLMESVDNLEKLDGELKRMIDAWLAGNAEELAIIMNENQSDPELARQLLWPRNKAWAEWVRHRLEQPGIVFMAVGAGHLAGPGSVQDELAARGVTTQRVQ